MPFESYTLPKLRCPAEVVPGWMGGRSMLLISLHCRRPSAVVTLWFSEVVSSCTGKHDKDVVGSVPTARRLQATCPHRG